MDRRPVPNHQQLALDLAHEMPQEGNDSRPAEALLPHLHEQPSAGRSNERLEFLGDSVIGLIISEALWQRYPEDDEGSLTTRRAAIVSARAILSPTSSRSSSA